jgi:hypothetical protein
MSLRTAPTRWRFMKPSQPGAAMAAKIAAIRITTSSSIRVNPAVGLVLGGIKNRIINTG